MDRNIAKIKEIENQIEDALWSMELQGDEDKALLQYQQAEEKLVALEVTSEDPPYSEQQRVLAYCLMRQSNLVRQKGELEKALAIGERELVAARASGDDISISRTLMSNGTNLILSGGIKEGLVYIEQAREIFASGDSFDHHQGLGWYWILQADLANAGLVDKTPDEILKFADSAIEVLMPIENWPGVARGYAAKAQVFEKLVNEEFAANNREKQQYYEGLTEKNKSSD